MLDSIAHALKHEPYMQESELLQVKATFDPPKVRGVPAEALYKALNKCFTALKDMVPSKEVSMMCFFTILFFHGKVFHLPCTPQMPKVAVVYCRKAINDHLQGIIQSTRLDLSHFLISLLQLWIAAESAKYGKYRIGPGW
jgi:hypothetical protein